MKKLPSVVAALIVAMTPISAFASSHHGSGRSAVSAARYTVCAVQDCALTGLHIHNGNNYIAHYYGDGHDYHAYCNTPDCVLTGYHSHDGVYCFGHTAYDGHSYHHAGGGHH